METIRVYSARFPRGQASCEVRVSRWREPVWTWGSGLLQPLMPSNLTYELGHSGRKDVVTLGDIVLSLLENSAAQRSPRGNQCTKFPPSESVTQIKTHGVERGMNTLNSFQGGLLSNCALSFPPPSFGWFSVSFYLPLFFKWFTCLLSPDLNWKPWCLFTGDILRLVWSE